MCYYPLNNPNYVYIMRNFSFEACTLVADHAPFEQEQNRDKLFVTSPAAIVTEEVSPDGKMKLKTTHRIVTINCDTSRQIIPTLERNRDCARMVGGSLEDFTVDLLRQVREGYAMRPTEQVKKELRRRGHSTHALEVPYPQRIVKI